jgi:proteasome lid subunit RPN8/RPN11
MADALTEGQREALEALHSIARVSDGALAVDLDLDYGEPDGPLTVRVYVSSASLLSSDQGADLEDWEPIDILIYRDFPYGPPIAWGRDDLPELPHQAQGSGFCVRVEHNNWNPTAGIPGFLRAVIDAYQHIALGTLQGYLQPWRPMDSYLGDGCAVIRADLPAADRTGPEISFRWAVGVPVGENRTDIIEWLDVAARAAAVDLTEFLSRELARITVRTPNALLVPAVTISKPIALEYSNRWLGLLYKLEEQGADSSQLLGHLVRATAINHQRSEEQERTAVLFRVAADTGPTAEGQGARFAVTRLTQHDAGLLDRFYAAGEDADSQNQMREEVLAVMAPWARVYDGRPESVLKRMDGRSTEKLARARILLLGCGGLGAPIAEHCVRSGAALLHIVDSGRVNPGILSRQPYEDADIGKHKAKALAERLGRIRRENRITASVGDIIYSDLLSGVGQDQYDLVIDATANRSVAAKIERTQRDQHDPWPTLVTVAISQHATHGVAAVTPRGAVGAGIDLLRQLGLKTCLNTALRDVYEAFFPPEAGRLNFRPDTSCSDTTFIGSTTDLGALAAQLLDGALARLDPQLGAIVTGPGPPHRSLSIVRLGNDNELKAARVVLDVPSDHVVMDHEQTYEGRIDETAMEAMREHIRASVNGRTPGAGHTGGLLLGQFDSTCRIAWVSQVTGLPPGSTATPLKIQLEMDEVRDFLDERSSHSDGMLTLIGIWHSHPTGSTEPSETDRETMRGLVVRPEWRSAPALLLVLPVPDDPSASEPTSSWEPQIHAETFVASF